MSYEQFLFSEYYRYTAGLPEVTKAVMEGDLNKLIKVVDRSGLGLHTFDEYENGPFHMAIMKNNAPILDYLLSKDTTHLNKQNFMSETPLMIALSERKYELAEKVLLAGADANIPDGDDVSPLQVAVTVPHTPHIVHLLIKHGADVNHQLDIYNPMTPLHWAVDNNNLESVCMLLYYNADANVENCTHYTPFMKALEKRNVEIQEALFEYVDDYNVTTTDSGLSVLGLALVNDSPFTKEMIMRGADVNRVNSNENGAFFFAMEYYRHRGRFNVNIIKLMWEKMDYLHPEDISVLRTLQSLETPIFHSLIDIFIGSNKFDVIAESVRSADDFTSFIVKCREHNLSLEKFSELCSVLLMHGYCPKEMDLILVYCQWGYCEIYEVLIHMRIRQISSSIHLGDIPSKLIHDVRHSTNKLLDKLVSIIQQKNDPLDDVLTMVMFRVLDNFVYPPLINAYLEMQTDDCVTLRIMGLPKVPSLLQLSRDKTRDHIKRSYNVKTCSELYTLINNLNVADGYKEILTFKTVVYKPAFKKDDFERYTTMLRMIQLKRADMHPLVEDAVKNAVVN